MGIRGLAHWNRRNAVEPWTAAVFPWWCPLGIVLCGLHALAQLFMFRGDLSNSINIVRHGTLHSDAHEYVEGGLALSEGDGSLTPVAGSRSHARRQSTVKDGPPQRRAGPGGWNRYLAQTQSGINGNSPWMLPARSAGSELPPARKGDCGIYQMQCDDDRTLVDSRRLGWHGVTRPGAAGSRP